MAAWRRSCRALSALALVLTVATTASAATTKSAGLGLTQRQGPARHLIGKPAPRSSSLTVTGQVTALAADGGQVLVVTQAGRCRQAELWTPLTQRLPVHLADPASCRPGLAFAQVALASSQVLWVDFATGRQAGCSGPYLADLAHAKPGATLKGRKLGVVCATAGDDVSFDLSGNDGLLAFASYRFCTDAAGCSAEYGQPMRAGRNQVDLWAVVGDQAKQVLPPVDGPRQLLGTSAGLMFVRETDGRLISYDTAGVAVQTLDPGLGLTAARLDGAWAVVLKGPLLTAYGYDGRPTRTLTLPAAAHLWDFDGGLVLYSIHGVLHLLDTGRGQDRVFRAVRGLVAAQLEPNGLSYAFNTMTTVKGQRQLRGRVVFLARAALGG